MTNDTHKRRLIAELINREGGFVDHPADRGGPTCWGITLAVARAHGYSGDMRAMSREVAARIYAGLYWDNLKLDDVAKVSTALVEYLFDFGVNSGPGRAAKTLQRLLNVLNDRGRYYADIAVDGALGQQTLTALCSFAEARGAGGLHVLAEAFNAERIAFCCSLAERSPSQEAFAFGWFRRVVELAENVRKAKPVPAHWLGSVETKGAV